MIKMEGKSQHEDEDNIMSVFTVIQDSFIAEQKTKEDIRNHVHDLEQSARLLLTHYSVIHQTSQSKLNVVIESSISLFDEVKVKLASLQQIIPPNSYYRYHDHWRFVMQRLSFLTLLKMYLEQSILLLDSGGQTCNIATKQEVATFLGVQSEAESGFHLDVDDYLLGLLTLTNELSRLAVNSVILGNYHVPIQIASFISSVSSGFRILNLKNDHLRRKFDSLKYDMKRVEEIVYDISIRGLVTAKTDQQ